MPKYGVKTYGRFGQKQSNASLAFDDVIGAKEDTSVTQSWGKAADTYLRKNQNGEDGTKRRKADKGSAFGDPFTFESDEDSPRKKSARVLENKESEPTCMGPPPSPPPQFTYGAKIVKTSIRSLNVTEKRVEEVGNGKSEEIEYEELSDDEAPSLIRKSVKSYSRTKVPVNQEKQNLSEKLTKPSGQLPISMFFKSVAEDSKNGNSSNKGSDILTNSTVKEPVKTYSKPRKFFTSKNRNGRGPLVSRSKDHTYSQGMHKFTVSRRNKEDEDDIDVVDVTIDDDDEELKNDHNYSYMSNTKRLTADHTYSSSTDKQKLDPFLNRGTVSGEHAYGKNISGTNSKGDLASDGLDSADEESNNFLYDSDNELTSGDPEIIFNSPRKRAKEASRLVSDDGHDTDSLPEDTCTSDLNDSQKMTDSQNTVISICSSSDSQMSCHGSQGIKTVARKKLLQSPAKSIGSPMSIGSQSGTESPTGKKVLERKYEIFRSRRPKLEKDAKKTPVTRRILTSPKKSPTKAQYNPRQWISRSRSDTGLEFDSDEKKVPTATLR